MNFLFPHFLWLLPALSVPIIIHLLNLVRYRRQKWAAIEFLLTSEYHIVRRAKLKQLLLMLLRISILAALLFALAAPLVGGGLAALLGTRSESIAILVDTSMSMSTVSIGGTALDRAKREAAVLLESLPRGAATAAASFTRAWDSPFGAPVTDPIGVASFVTAMEPSICGTDVPAALASAAEMIKKGNRDGSICLLTDLRASGWAASNDAVWESLRGRLEEANIKRIVVVNCGPESTTFNAAVTSVRTDPPILIPGRTFNMEVDVVWAGRMPEGQSATLYLDDKRVDSRIIAAQADTENGGGRATCSFSMPALSADAHTGYIEIPADGLAADNRYNFLIRPTDAIPLLIVEGEASEESGARPSEFLALALSPGGKGLFATRIVQSSAVTSDALAGNRAVFLANIDKLSPEATEALEAYVDGGGLAIFFLGSQLKKDWWNELAAGSDEADGGFAPLALTESEQTKRDKPFRLGWTDVRFPITARLEKEGMGSVSVLRYFRGTPAKGAQMLVSLENGDPYLCSKQVGRGKVLAFVTSGHEEDSNLPFTPIFLPLAYRLLYDHMRSDNDALAYRAEDEITTTLTEGPFVEIIFPSGQVFRATPEDAETQLISFRGSKEAGIYRIRDWQSQDSEGALFAAVNPPSNETLLESIDADEVRRLLDGFDVKVITTSAGSGAEAMAGGEVRAGLSFFLAALALMFLVGESIFAWSMGKQDTK